MSARRAEEGEERAPLLAARGLVVRYGPLLVLNGANLEIEPGEIVALAGENGAGKTTLVRCLAGDLAYHEGTVTFAGRPLPPDPTGVARAGVAVVWQDLSLCDNLDVASNLLLGEERRFVVESDIRRHARAAAILERLHVRFDTSQGVRSLSGGQRQLLAVARAVRERPRLLVLDEPTAALGLAESAEVERLIATLAAQDTAILLVSHDLPLIFRLAHRIVVMRSGRAVAEVDPTRAYPDDVIALMSGHAVDVSARQQLNRLHGLVDQLATSDRSSSLSLILSTLGAALREDCLVIHRLVDADLCLAAAVGLSPALARAVARLPLGPAGGPIGSAAAAGEPVIDDALRTSAAWAPFGPLAGLAGSWSVPVLDAGAAAGVITVLRRSAERPNREELELLTLYAGYVASALERDRLFDEVRTRNRVLETIREVLETLAGPIPVADGLRLALRAVLLGLGADEVLLSSRRADGAPVVRGRAGSSAGDPEHDLAVVAGELLETPGPDGVLRVIAGGGTGIGLAICFQAPAGRAALIARLGEAVVPDTAPALCADAAHCLQLALEREEFGRIEEEAAALRRSRQLQRDFLSRLSHELRTPLTAIQGYAQSLRQSDVTWDEDSVDRFLSRMASESARLGRLVEDLLDFSALESGTLRLQRDWCDLLLVLDAARSCLPPPGAGRVTITSERTVPAIWADHDRLEQVFVNLIDNALRHNPPGTHVQICVGGDDTTARVSVCDDGGGLPDAVAAAPFEAGRRNSSPTAGTGLGLSIAAAIVRAHGGTIRVHAPARGTCFQIALPVESAEHTAEVLDA